MKHDTALSHRRVYVVNVNREQKQKAEVLPEESKLLNFDPDPKYSFFYILRVMLV